MADQGDAPVLPWLRVPIKINAGCGVPLANIPGIDPRLRNALSQSGRKGEAPRYTELFPVQSAVWTELAGGLGTAHDVCIAAPTGSGKTLAYALPLVNGLASLRCPDYRLQPGRPSPGAPQRSSPAAAAQAGLLGARCLQALVVLPTRGLAVQGNLAQEEGVLLGRGLANSTPQLAWDFTPAPDPTPDLDRGLPLDAAGTQQTEQQEQQRGEQPAARAGYAGLAPAGGSSGAGQAGGGGGGGLLPRTHRRGSARPSPGPGMGGVLGGQYKVQGLGQQGRGEEGWQQQGRGEERWQQQGAGGVGEGERSSVEVLVATPGRLVAHLQHTPGFTLSHLRFLVSSSGHPTHIAPSGMVVTEGLALLVSRSPQSSQVVDEADRLLRQRYQDWLPLVLAAITSAPAPPPSLAPAAGPPAAAPWGLPAHFSHSWTAAAGAAWCSAGPFGMPRCVKLVVSATLTRDPAQLGRLELHCPRFVATTGGSSSRYSLPGGLSEYWVLSSADRKPLLLLALLTQLLPQGPVLLFASSQDTTHKLYLLLHAALEGGQHQVMEYAGNLTAAQRANAITRFKSGKVRVLVASDAMTRGMDIPEVSAVVNYDAPLHAKTYVHRAGRTARAGRSGAVYTLLRSQDAGPFRSMLRKAGNTRVTALKLAPALVVAAQPRLDSALQQVAELLTAEAEDDQGRAISSGRGPSRIAPIHESRGAGLKVAEAGTEPAVAVPTATAGVEEGAAGSQRQGRAAQGKSTRTKRQRDDN
ncbi:P-loop containing nucleoside triphosphate hydrolase protein [Haematococcus lacustris]